MWAFASSRTFVAVIEWCSSCCALSYLVTSSHTIFSIGCVGGLQTCCSLFLCEDRKHRTAAFGEICVFVYHWLEPFIISCSLTHDATVFLTWWLVLFLTFTNTCVGADVVSASWIANSTLFGSLSFSRWADLRWISHSQMSNQDSRSLAFLKLNYSNGFMGPGNAKWELFLVDATQMPAEMRSGDFKSPFCSDQTKKKWWFCGGMA